VVHRVFTLHHEHCESDLVQLVRRQLVLCEEESLDGQAAVGYGEDEELWLTATGYICPKKVPKMTSLSKGEQGCRLVTMCDVGERH